MTTPRVPLRIGFIGSGQMATALARGLVEAGLVSPEQVVAVDVAPAAAERFRQETGGEIVRTIQELAQNADILFLAVKPQHMAGVLAELAPCVLARHVVVSIAAGISLHVLTERLGAGCRLIRVMPNTPCLVGRGASGLARGGGATAEDAETVLRLLSAVGFAAEVPEGLMDAVTGLSGSGPAFVYVMIEALADGGVRMGLPRDLALKLAAHTVGGAAQMVLATGLHPGALKDAVASPGGTTMAGLHALEQAGVRGTLMNAVQAATLRARELS
jgi:pyrroline-5-carboxylate reductase